MKALLFALLVVPMIGCTGMGYVPIVAVPIATNYAGIAKCDYEGKPVIVLSTLISEDETPYILLHEQVHVEQIRRRGKGCEEFVEQYSQDPDFRFQMEAEAHCKDFEARVKNGYMDGHRAFPMLVHGLRRQFPMFTLEHIWRELPCRGDYPQVTS